MRWNRLLLAAAAVLAGSSARADFLTHNINEHMDFTIRNDGGGVLSVGIAFEFRMPEAEFETNQVLSIINPAFASQSGLSSDLGLGATAFVAPQSRDARLPSLAISAAEDEPEVFTDDDFGVDLQLSVVAVRGPGTFAIWQGLNFAPDAVFVASFDGLDMNDFVPVQAGTHDEYSFGFSALGRYEVDVVAGGTRAGSPVASGVFTLFFEVGAPPVPTPVPATAVVGLAGVAILAAGRRRANAHVGGGRCDN